MDQEPGREPDTASLEHLGLEEGEALRTTPRQMLFGWSLVLLAFMIVVLGAAAVIAILLFLGMFATIVGGFFSGGFSSA